MNIIHKFGYKTEWLWLELLTYYLLIVQFVIHQMFLISA